MSLNALSANTSNLAADRSLVLLHGWGANGRDVAGVANYLSLPKYQLWFPEAPWPHPAPGGRMWYALPADLSFEQAHTFQRQPDLQKSRALLLQWLQALPENTGIPLEKTVLGGFSQGAAMALDVGLQLPLAGLLMLSGYCHSPLAPGSSQYPIRVIHGRQDPVVPLAQAQLVYERLLDLGVSVDYTELDMGHEIDLDALKLVQRFCEEQM